MTPAEHAAAIRAVLEQVTAFEVGDPRRFNEAVAAIGCLDELAERATELERERDMARSANGELANERNDAMERAERAERELRLLRADEAAQAIIDAGIERERAERAEAALAEAVDVAIWMSGSSDFSPGGIAHEGWLKMRPQLHHAMEALPDRAALGEAAP